jgi:hypothetical protein
LAQAVTLLTWIREVLGSKPGRDTDNPERRLVVFLSPSSGSKGWGLEIDH